MAEKYAKNMKKNKQHYHAKGATDTGGKKRAFGGDGPVQEDMPFDKVMQDYVKSYAEGYAKEMESSKPSEEKDAGQKERKSGSKDGGRGNMMQEMFRRQMVMSMFRSLQGSQMSFSQMAAYVGGAFLVMHKCGGIRNNLSSMFNMQLDQADKAHPELAEKCASTKESDPLPYEPMTAAMDKISLDMLEHQSIRKPGITREEAEAGIKEGNLHFDRWMDNMSGFGDRERAEMLSFRQKMVAGLVLEDPSKADIFGIEVGGPVWDKLVEDCHADVAYLQDADGMPHVEVKSFHVPQEGFFDENGDPWQEGMVRGNRYHAYHPFGEVGLPRHGEAMDDILSKGSVSELAAHRQGKESTGAIKTMLRMQSRMRMMQQDCYSDEDIQDTVRRSFEKVSEKSHGKAASADAGWQHGAERDASSGWSASDELLRRVAEMGHGSGREADVAFE